LLWVGTSRSREQELCDRHGIRLVKVDVSGMRRSLSLQALRSMLKFGRTISAMSKLLRREKPDAVLAFGGYVSAPILAAARMRGVPYFLHEQNTVPGLVNRLFGRRARCTFLSFELALGWSVHGKTRLVGMPVRKVQGSYPPEVYPEGLDRNKATVLVSGGSQGALSMDRALLPAVREWLRDSVQVVWQTGEAGYREIADAVGSVPGAFVFPSLPDLYPFYAISRVVVGRSGASTLAEVMYFGLPCVLVPLPWSAEDHQWINAGLVEAKGSGFRVRQDEQCARTVDHHVRELLADGVLYEKMSRRALDLSPANAASAVVKNLRSMVGAS
jgi:UDP-N-acetylglucosamine--N-acetylmuramyl-(pentapeptide) pyrophosphoryl-undecaprenol N-acetylglucosamine transferase